MSNLKTDEQTKTNEQDARSKALLCFHFKNRNLNQELNGNLHYTFEIYINTFFLGRKKDGPLESVLCTDRTLWFITLAYNKILRPLISILVALDR